MRRTAAFIFLSLLLVSSRVTPQTTPPAPPQVKGSDGNFTLKTSTEVVLVNVTVRDKDGNFVRDLKQEDFAVSEDGKNQPVVSLDVENTDALVANNDVQVPNLLGTLNTKATAATAKAPAAAPPPEVTKEMFRDRRLIVLFFDLSSMQPEEIKRASQAAAQYIDKQMRPADLVSVVTLQNTLDTVQEFTNDAETLTAAVQSFNPDSGTGFEAGATGAASADTGVTDDTFTADDTEFNVVNTDRRLDALKNIAETLTGIEQKKSLLYFSSGMSQTGVENQTQLRAATNAAVRANLSIYTMDMRGLQAIAPGGGAAGRGPGAGGSGGGRGGVGGGGRGGGSGMFNGLAMQSAFDSNAASQETLVTLAADTGGKAFLDTNDFQPAFTKVQDDTAMYYVLGYTSTNVSKDGKYRRIQVSVKRKDVKIDFRHGYYAEADFQHLTKESREQQLMDQLTSDLPSTDLPLYMSTGYFRMADTRYFVPVSLVVPASAIPFAGESAQDKATIDIRGIARDERTKFPFGTIQDTVKYAISSEEVKRKNVQYDTGFPLPPGTYTVKFVVRENQTGQIGSFEAKVVVPNLKDAPVKISSVIASGQKQTAKPKKDNPLFRNGTELIPSVTHVFSTDQHLFLYYEIYDPARPTDGDQTGKSAARILTNVTFFKGNVKAFETPLVQTDQVNTPDRKAAAVELDVPLNSLKPGFYTCQVNVIDDAAGKFVFPRLALLVR